jgi:tetratricopeptide (TPR) repeat protein
VSSVSRAGNSLSNATLRFQRRSSEGRLTGGPCKTRPGQSRRDFLLLGVTLLWFAPLHAQEREGDEAWSQGRYGAAQAAYTRALASNPQSARANLRIGVILSWQGKLDSALTFLARARASEPADQHIRLVQAEVMAWNKQYSDALLRYDSLLTIQPGLREALLGRARTLSWAGRLDEAQSIYRSMIAKDSTDRDAVLGAAQVNAWKGNLSMAERGYRAILLHSPRDLEARVGIGYVYLWEGRTEAAARQSRYVLTIDSTHQAARKLRRALRAETGPKIETSANWSNDSDHNTSFWQILAASAPLGGGVGIFGSVNALESRDPVRDATRLGGELGLSIAAGSVRLTGAAGARRLNPEIAAPRTVATYRGQLRYRPTSALGLSLGYARTPFDEIASLIERELNMELLDAGFDARPLSGLTVYAGGGELWLSDGNSRWSLSAGFTHKILRSFFFGVFGRTLAYQRPGVGYFSPDRFSVLEGIAGYNLESGSWVGSLSGGVGAQQVGKRGVAQSEWHLEGRLGQSWGSGNRVEAFGLVTNSAVSSTTGAFRYGSAGILVRLGL